MQKTDTQGFIVIFVKNELFCEGIDSCSYVCGVCVQVNFASNKRRGTRMQAILPPSRVSFLFGGSLQGDQILAAIIDGFLVERSLGKPEVVVSEG